MIIKNSFNNNELSKLHEFKYKYFNLYPSNLQEEIENNLFLGFTNNEDTINQIYCYLNLVEDNINHYKSFIKYLKTEFNLQYLNIIEVGSGSIPLLAHYLEEKYKTSVAVQDPITLFANYTKGNIYKDLFNENTDISNYNLIIGYNLCESTENIIISAIKNKKDFSVATRGCCHSPSNFKEKSTKSWHKYLIDIAKKLENNNYEIKVSYFPENYFLENPIITEIYKKSMKN